LQSGGIERTYILHVSPSYDGTRQTPLVLNLHGFGSNARQQAIYSGFPGKSDREGFIVVTPDATGTPKHWNYPGLGGADDIGFMRDLLDRVEADLCIDAKRVFVSGMSNGAAMSSFIACAMPDRITAIAPVAASVFARTCTGVRAIPTISFRGTEDPCVPFEGGTSKCGQFLPVVAAKDAMRAWAEHNRCNVTPAEQQFSAHVNTITYSECSDGAAVVLFVIDGGGHTWPGSIDVPRLGATSHEVNATDEIWQFFAAQGNLRR
jgi:polyhydroxybutyrate depolymerase